MKLLVVTAVLAMVSASALAQAPTDSGPTASTRELDDSTLSRLPLDNVDDGLRLLTGVTSGLDGAFAVRGARPGDLAVLLDGVPVGAGMRGSVADRLRRAFRDFAAQPVLLGLNGVRRLSLTTGPGGASEPGGAGGVLRYFTPAGSERWNGAFLYSTDEPWGAGSGQGYNRIDAAGGGAAGRFRIYAAGALSGAKSTAATPGSDEVPLFAPAGPDTTVAIPSVLGDPLADTAYIDVYRFAVGRGECDAFQRSSNEGIRGNYGVDCGRARVPATANSNGQALARLDWSGGATRVWASAVLAQDQRRPFDYANLYHPVQLAGERTSSHAFTLAAEHQLRVGGDPIDLRGYVSLQRDMAERGPLTGDSELDSRDPTGGFLLAPLDFQFGFEDFPVNAELVDNYRRNTPGSRRSPYEIENPAQYALVDRWRDGAYASFGFSEAGGPVGQLNLFEEERLVAGMSVGLDVLQTRLTTGADLTGYDVRNYTHGLTSQVFSDVYIESPSAAAVWVEDRIGLGKGSQLVAGVRWDHFASGARRPWLTDPLFGVTNYFPRSFSYGYDGTDWDPARVEFREDEAHAALSGSLRFSYEASPRFDIRAGIGTFARMPDLQAVYASVNTDWELTTGQQPWGTDLDFERDALGEVGVRYDAGSGFTVDGSIWTRNGSNQVILAVVNPHDPNNGGPQEMLQYVNSGGGVEGIGLDLVVSSRAGWLTGWLGYSFQSLDRRFPDATGGTFESDAAESRPHTVTFAAVAATPVGWRAGSTLGAVLDRGALALAFRAASGAPYTSCDNVGSSTFTLSGDPCIGDPFAELNDQRLPSVRRLDLKVSKGFGLGSRTLSAFLDARNLLSAENVARVFAVNGSTTNETALGEFTSELLISYRQEGENNGMAAGDGALDLRFGGIADPRQGCATWVDTASRPAAPNCVALIRTEERFGDGDGVFSVAEQERAAEALYRVQFDRSALLSPGRLVRIGVSLEL